jgi:hypothetical protein
MDATYPSFCRMSLVEHQLRCEKGLCFTCDENYTWSHRCSNKQLTCFDLDEESLLPPTEDPLADNVALHHLSLQAFRGSGFPGRATLYF